MISRALASRRSQLCAEFARYGIHVVRPHTIVAVEPLRPVGVSAYAADGRLVAYMTERSLNEAWRTRARLSAEIEEGTS